MDNSISLIAAIRDKANSYIIKELKKSGINGLVPSHGEILMQLINKGTITKTEIAEKIGRDRSTVTTLVDKLEKLGYVSQERSTTDNRYIHLSLTQKGKDFEGIFWNISRNLFEKEYNGIPEEERALFLTVLDKIYKNL